MAKDDKKGFIIYCDTLDAIEEFSDEEVGKLLRAVNKFYLSGELPDFERGLNAVFKMVIKQLMRDKEKYKKACERKSESAKERWKKSKTSNALYNSIDMHNVVGDKDKDTDTDTDKGKDKEREKDTDTVSSDALAFGSTQNVFLSTSELSKLREMYPDDWEERIEELGLFMLSTGREYNNHFATIVRRAHTEPKPKPVVEQKGRLDWIDDL